MKKLLLLTLFFFSLFALQAQENDSLKSIIEEFTKEYRYDKIIELLSQQEDLSTSEKKTLADAQYKSGKFYDALDSYNALYDLDSNNLFLFQKARIYSKLEDESQALYWYYHLANKAINNVYYWKITAKSAMKEARFDIAFKSYSIAYELNKEDLEIISEFSNLLQKLEYYDSADSILLASLELNPSAKFLKRQRVMLLYRMKRNNELVDLAEELFNQNDSAFTVQKIAGIANYHEKNYARSIALLENVIEIEKESDLLYYYLGLAYRESGNAQKAAECIEKSIDLGVSNNLPNYYTQLAVSYEEAGAIAKAIQAYKIAYNQTKDKVLLYHLARNYDLLYKDKQVAMSYYQKYLDEKDTANEYLMNYSKHRIQELKSSAHFETDTL